MIGRTNVMLSLFRLITRVAPTNATVLITGETGTGKELVARSIHDQSSRKNWVPVNCAAIPPGLVESELFGHERGAFTGAHERGRGKFETANAGTLFLDEIAELSLQAQACLLRVLDDHCVTRVGGTQPIRVDVRLIAATHRDLALLVREGTFREDLYHRIRVVNLRVPPLRERLQDIPLLASEFVREFNQAYRKNVSITPEAVRVLLQYPWVGNVRELRNLIESAVILSTTNKLMLTPQDLIIPHPLDPCLIEEVERQAVERALAITDGNRGAAARLLGRSRKWLWSALKKYDGQAS